MTAPSGARKARMIYTWNEARAKARAYGFSTQQEFVDYECAGTYQLPKNADEVWAEEWTSWDDFLGVRLGFDQARDIARTCLAGGPRGGFRGEVSGTHEGGRRLATTTNCQAACH